MAELKTGDICCKYLETPVGLFYIEADEIGITKVMLESEEEKQKSFSDIQMRSGNLTSCNEISYNECAQKYVEMVCEQLQEYFRGTRKDFNVPVHMKGTEFQQSVWNALREIPYGETRSYKDIAVRIGNPKAARAVGMANNRNQILILIPCHRVIGANGSMVGFGCGLPAKEYLLNLEKQS